MNYRDWNIQQLISESININAEIHARIKTIINMENAFLTYNPKAPSEKYEELMKVAMDLVRKGSKE